MPRLMFVLSGEHRTLPAAEATAAIKAERKAFKAVEQMDQVLIAETKADPQVLASRLAMSREICHHVCTAGANEEEITEAVASCDIVDLMHHGKSFAVKIDRVKRSAPAIDKAALERKLAGMIAEEIDFKVDLDNPQTEFLGILTGDKCVFGITAARVDRRQFTRRRPMSRAVFHPSTLKPALARCLVNLARTPRSGAFLDPFCGVGGILLEAGLIGAKLVGVDIERDMIDGAKTNLESEGVKDFQLMVGDARKLPSLEVDAIATDPPYGRQSTTGGSELKKLYTEALPSIASVLKRRGHLCITSPSEIDLAEVADDAELRTIETHEQRVHRSLTRRIYVFKKK